MSSKRVLTPGFPARFHRRPSRDCGQDVPVKLRVGCQFEYQGSDPTATAWQVRPRPDGRHDVIWESWTTTPQVACRSYLDSYGNRCDRLTMPAGLTTVRYEAVVETPDGVDERDETAREIPVDDLPDDTLIYLLPSRYCWPDVLGDQAWQLFADAEPGWARVQAVSDWTHRNIRYSGECSSPLTTAADVLSAGAGVCRDYAHVGVSFCRALNIPARYMAGYLPNMEGQPPEEPMDFCSWFEAYLGDRWWTFDPRNNAPRVGRVTIGRGRDAVDVAMATAYGAPVLQGMTVWADEVGGEEPARVPG